MFTKHMNLGDREVEADLGGVKMRSWGEYDQNTFHEILSELIKYFLKNWLDKSGLQ